MVKIKNPLTVVKGGGTPAVLVQKTITQNGDYSASDDGANGYSSVHVDVAPPTVYYSRRGRMYFADTVIPDTYTGTNLSDLEGSSNLVRYTNLAPNVHSFGNYELNDCYKLEYVHLPYITSIGGIGVTMAPHPNAVCQVGSLGNPVTSLNRAAFYGGSGIRRGEGWTIHVYTTATTLAEAAALLPNSPWGANYATIVFHNSTTGEVITE